MTIATITPPAVQPLGRRRGVFNNKGGVGKTTVTVQIGAALARRGKRVLLVDLDPSANLTRRTAVQGVEHAITISEALRVNEKGGAAAAIYPCGWDSSDAALISVIPAELSLRDRDKEASEPGSHNRLARILYGVTDAYDFTLFDTRPTLAHLEQMVVRALDGDGDGYYVVVEPGADAIGGAYRLTQEVAGWSDAMEVGSPALGVIVNLYDSRFVSHQGRTEGLTESMTPPDGSAAPPVLEPYLPRAVRIAEVQDLAEPSTGDPRLIREGHLARFDALAAVIDW